MQLSQQNRPNTLERDQWFQSIDKERFQAVVTFSHPPTTCLKGLHYRRRFKHRTPFFGTHCRFNKETVNLDQSECRKINSYLEIYISEKFFTTI